MSESKIVEEGHSSYEVPVRATPQKLRRLTLTEQGTMDRAFRKAGKLRQTIPTPTEKDSGDGRA